MTEVGFKFLGYIVSESSFEVTNPFFVNPSQKNELSVDVQQNFNKDNARFVEVVLRIKLKNEENSFRVALTIKGGFEADKEMSDELFKQMYTINAPAILFPYARAFVSTLTGQAGVPQIILPLLNFTTKKEAPEVLEEKSVKI
jgi:preprotein translocase subunit SecB